MVKLIVLFITFLSSFNCKCLKNEISSSLLICESVLLKKKTEFIMVIVICK